MRVLHVLCDLSGGGAERLVLALCARSGGAHEVATVMGAGPLAEAFANAGVRTYVGAARSGLGGALEVARVARLARRVDVVHTHLFAGDTWGRPAARLAGTPVVTTEHNVNRDEGRRHRLVKRALARWTDRMVYVSEAARAYAEQVEGVCHPRASVIPNGVDLERFTLAGPGPGTRVLAVGRDVPQKGFDVLLNALPAGVHLRVAGEGPRRGVQAIGGATVEWLGPRDDIPALLAESDVLVVPSRWEGFGLAALEGMAAGVTVIASRVDGLAEVVGDAGVLVPPGDPRALRGALERVSADRAMRARYRVAGPARAAGFSLDRCAERYSSLYAELVGAG